MSNKKLMSLSDRMKEYENVTNNTLIKRTPVIARIDGRAFHTFTKGFTKPFDLDIHNAVVYTCEQLVLNVQGCKFTYSQSDEISLLITDYDTLQTDSYFDYRIQKICSILSASATLYFNKYINEHIIQDRLNDMNTIDFWHRKANCAMFDTRVFNLSKEEVCNYFIWRQQDAIRNSVESLARSQFSQKELHKRNNIEMKQMLLEEYDIDWSKLPLHEQRGFCVYRLPIDEENNLCLNKLIPIFQEDREFIEKYVN